MPTTYKILGQAAPSATTETDLVTVAASSQNIVSTICIANRSTTVATFRISSSAAGAATTNKDYIVYDANIGANQSIYLTIGCTLATTDKIRVYASTANLSFTAFGSVIS